MMKLTKDEKRAIPFLLPGLIVTAILIVYPLFYIVTMSFSDNSFGGGGFAGIKNYVSLFHNPQFPKAIRSTLWWTFGTVVLSYAIGTLLALLINRKSIKLKGFWIGMIFVQVWSCAPYVMLMMTAGLQQLPADLYESAELDGATWYEKLLHITFPLLKDISFICILMVLVWAINEFSLIFIMTQGGHDTTTLAMLVYNQFKVLNINLASASAIMQLLITMIFAGIYVRCVVKEDEEE